MIAITKRLRLFRGVPDSKEELEKFRKEARDTLSRPYQFEAKPQVKPWELPGTDPISGFFKPFSKVNALAADAQVKSAKSYSSLALVKSRLASLEWRRLSLPLGGLALVLGAFVLWQVFATDTTVSGVISKNPVPGETNISSPVAAPVGEVVPPGTELEPGGPYTGTGSTQPTGTSPRPSGSTNLNQGTPAPASTPTPAPACPTGLVCSGQALDGTACTTDSPCRVVQLTTPLATGGTIIETGRDSVGNSCSPVNPCVLTH